MQLHSLMSKLALLCLHFPRLRLIWSRSLHATAGGWVAGWLGGCRLAGGEAGGRLCRAWTGSCLGRVRRAAGGWAA